MALLTRPELAELRGPSYTVSGALAVWCGLSRLAPRCLARRVSQGAASSPEEGSICVEATVAPAPRAPGGSSRILQRLTL
jgi:hypothetical protein